MATSDELRDPALGYHAVLAGTHLIGFRSFGPDGRVPGWDYDESALDTGGGLRPELTGLGLGRAVIFAAGLAFGRAQFAPAAFRVTVAHFNTRAFRTVRSLGFEQVGTFNAARDGSEFAGARTELLYLDVPLDVLWARVADRGMEDPPMNRSDLVEMYDFIQGQRPDETERHAFDAVL